MTYNQAVIVMSIFSGRKDVCSLSFEERSLLGIRFDPRESAMCRDDALRILERLLTAHLEHRPNAD